MTDSQLDLPLHELLHQREWLSRLAAALVRDPNSAEDAAQQTWLQALLAKTPLRDSRTFTRGWPCRRVARAAWDARCTMTHTTPDRWLLRAAADFGHSIFTPFGAPNACRS